MRSRMKLPGWTAGRSWLLAGLALLAGATLNGAPGAAQQPAPGWQVQTAPPQGRDGSAPPAAGPLQAPPNTTIVPRSTTGGKPAAGTAGPAQMSFGALLTDDGQTIEQGVVWRVYRAGQGSEKAAFVSQHREANPTVRLEPGSYVVNVAFGRAHLTRK